MAWRTNRRTGKRFIATKPKNIESLAKSYAGPVEMVNPKTGDEGFLYQGYLFSGGPMIREEEVAMLVDSGMSEDEAIRAVIARRIQED
jgi:hypothetical protein